MAKWLWALKASPSPPKSIFRDGLLVLSARRRTRPRHRSSLGCPRRRYATTSKPPGSSTATSPTTSTSNSPDSAPHEKIVQKQEDWNLFDFSQGRPNSSTRFRESQSLLRRCPGQMLHEPGEASKIADQLPWLSPSTSPNSSPCSTVSCSSIAANRRKAFVKHIFGCRVDPTVQNQKYKDILCDNFEYAVLPMSWKQLPAAGAHIRRGRGR